MVRKGRRATKGARKGRSGISGCGIQCLASATDEGKTVREIRTEEQIAEKEQMIEAVHEFIKNNVVRRRRWCKCREKRKYELVKDMEDIGSRLQKYWIEIQTKGKKSKKMKTKRQNSEEIETKGKTSETISYIVSVSKFSTICPIGTHEEVASILEVIKQLFEMINAHPFIHEIKEVTVMEQAGGLVILVQKKSPKGSLRDLIYGLDEGNFDNSWSKKQSTTPVFRSDFQPDAINYITQILKGMLYLRKIGFPFLGNVHLGNVFLTEGEDGNNRCTITGHENALFGYRTSMYQKICESGYINSIDVIMLGHMLYELATCQPLRDVFPTKEQRKAIADKPVRKLLKFIFERSDTKMKHTLDEILQKIIEKGWYNGAYDLTEEDDVTVSEDIKELLGKMKV